MIDVCLPQLRLGAEVVANETGIHACRGRDVAGLRAIEALLGERAERGVAVLTQSSNMAINITRQARALPLAYVGTAGNQDQNGPARLGPAMLQGPRGPWLGMRIGGIVDMRRVEARPEGA